ncbi:hypothetical protein VCSRO91_2844 [Vibrio cholerae]|nr:hypothetical protein VCSRO91_2844 [Vibrio cholerae]
MSDSTNPTKYNFPYRKNYEAYLLFTWTVAALVLFFAPFFFKVPKGLYWSAALACLFVGMMIGHKAVELYVKKKRLKGYPLEFVDPTTPKMMKMFGIDKEVINRVQKNKKR